MSRLVLCALVSALFVAGCASEPIDPKLEASATYQTGFGDGCATSKARSNVYDKSVTRNEQAYAQDDLYKRGWNVGYRQCGSAMTQADPYSEPAPDWKTHGPLN